MLKPKKTGLLDGALFHNSANQDQRPADCDIDLLVIHSISLPPGEFGGDWIDDLFMNRLDADAHPYFQEISSLKVSCHLLIRRDGSQVQYVPLHHRAWHAGKSNYCGRECCNDFSIGIELEGSDEQAFTDAQYASLVKATRQIMAIYPNITQERITSHATIAPGRKTDPGPMFDWQKYFRLLHS
ncbi:MAG: 1,6-anhydro-N-acetylmuramyl-L-alanine amidase AmpD [Candidatus Thiodiazotropha weberae]|nr:1,6-anhydro-N-acetylmuramyl-L-alanine amidase AmpD [Candidatus Thiodiazotropha lotti]MCW4212333.1 1,6-anhydro-N-acetylmuramyl-L-alanine amidase AmpD [Candidatus Thiodiazotropha lotti]